MTVLFKKLLNLRSASLLKRSLHLTSTCHSYEGDGKTTVTILNKNYDYGLMIDNISEHGFILNNGVRTVGPMIIFPKTMLSWNIASSPDMNEESFSLLLNLEPRLDILVIGLDDEYPYNAPFLLNLKDLFKRHKIPTEILPVYRACSTFNFLNSENRYAAAALIPPKIRYVQDVLLAGNNNKQTPIEGDGSKPIGTIEIDRDPLIINTQVQELNADNLKKQKEMEHALRVRSPWRSDSDRVSKPPNPTTDKKNKKS